jgi:hypothetical protein
MAVHPANIDHGSHSKDGTLFTMNNHVEHAAISKESAGEAGAPTVMNEDPHHPVNWPLYKVESLIRANVASKLIHLKEKHQPVPDLAPCPTLSALESFLFMLPSLRSSVLKSKMSAT